MTERIFDRNQPYNNLPLLPPPKEAVLDFDVLRSWGAGKQGIGRTQSKSFQAAKSQYVGEHHLAARSKILLGN